VVLSKRTQDEDDRIGNAPKQTSAAKRGLMADVAADDTKGRW
jgi:hypothetical protein